MILCLRDTKDAEQDAALLGADGITAAPASVMHIKHYETELPNISDCQAVIYTSRHAINSAHAKLSTKAICVGAGSARAATRAGFENAIAGPAGAAELVETIKQTLSPEAGPLYWPHGAIVQMDIAAVLRGLGYVIFEDSLYELAPVESLPVAVSSEDACKSIEAIMCFSAQHLHHFARLLEAAGLWHHHQDWVLIVPSARVASSLSAQWSSLVIADAPTHKSMLASAKLWALHKDS